MRIWAKSEKRKNNLNVKFLINLVLLLETKVHGFNYCNAKESEIFKIARMNVKPDDRKKFMRELCNRGYIRPTMTGGDKVLCADERLLLEDGSESWIKSGVEEDIALVVEDMHQPIFAYWKIFGGTEVKIGVCAGCGKKIIKNSNRQKWCEECIVQLRSSLHQRQCLSFL